MGNKIRQYLILVLNNDDAIFFVAEQFSHFLYIEFV